MRAAAEALLAQLGHRADAALGQLFQDAGVPRAPGLDGLALLRERALLCGYTFDGRIAPGGHCRLVAGADGWLALTLAREDDWSLLPAWLEDDVAPAWEAVEEAVARRAVAPLVARARELGLAAAAAVLPAGPTPPWCVVHATGEQRAPPSAPPVVVELASLWAGPLAGRLLRQCGARVIKVESRTRPDGGRFGNAAFFEQLNGGKQCISIDFTRGALEPLLDGADIVIEGSRPRALRQLGIDAAAWVAARPGRTWVSISAYGRDPAAENWIGYGDDCGVAAGLSARLHAQTGCHVICGDAVADPLTGIHAALAAARRHASGSGGLLGLSLCDVTRHVAERHADGIDRP